jgi:hypothetical protein
VAVSRSIDSFDTRWPCVRNNSSESAAARDWDALTAARFAERPALSLVPDPVSAVVPDELESEEAGARRLLAAVATVNLRAEQSGLPTDQM